jgi:hypothetical protein
MRRNESHGFFHSALIVGEKLIGLNQMNAKSLTQQQKLSKKR